MTDNWLTIYQCKIILYLWYQTMHQKFNAICHRKRILTHAKSLGYEACVGNLPLAIQGYLDTMAAIVLSKLYKPLDNKSKVWQWHQYSTRTIDIETREKIIVVVIWMVIA